MTASDDEHVERWDLYCRVVDNYGDIGIAWRLARQLTRADREVRLRVDDLHAFACIEPRVDADAPHQRIAAIEVIDWDHRDEARVAPADVVVELFGCGLPQQTIEGMARENTRAPIWIDLEYLSAETWVDDFHGRPSPHPTLPLVKHFFYPGFSPRTGGLLIEAGLDDRRRAFLEDADEVDALWRRLHLPPRAANEKRVSLFAYPGDAVKPLFGAMASDPDVRWTVVVLNGGLAREPETCAVEERGALSIFTIPFIAQDDYDRLLWSCDINFVRGEDSFVRAQWAARPFVWHIYPQADDVHLAKLDAFADRYEAGLPDAARDAQRALWHTWNARDTVAAEHLQAAWTRWCDVLPELAAHAEVWRQNLASHAGLVDCLTAFVAERRAALLK